MLLHVVDTRERPPDPRRMGQQRAKVERQAVIRDGLVAADTGDRCDVARDLRWGRGCPA
jgi:hypothetical protein